MNFFFDSWIAWKTVTVFWWIHWDEVVWEKIIKYFVKKIKSDKINIISWKLIFAFWNLEAMKIWKREYSANLNRCFNKKLFESNKEIYEYKRAKELSEILDVSDALLDIHSVSSKSDAFIFSENTEKNINLVKNIFSWKIILGYWEILDDVLAWDTENYMHNLWKLAHTLECWNHNEEKSFLIWIEVVENFLNYFWIIELKKKKKLYWEFFKVYDIFKTKTWNFKFEKEFKNFDFIKKWEKIWYDWVQEIFSKSEFYMLLPNFWQQKIWEEVFFYWDKVKNNL